MWYINDVGWETEKNYFQLPFFSDLQDCICFKISTTVHLYTMK